MIEKQLPSNGQVMADAEEPEGGWSERGPIRWPVVICMTEHGACLPCAPRGLADDALPALCHRDARADLRRDSAAPRLRRPHKGQGYFIRLRLLGRVRSSTLLPCATTVCSLRRPH